jgi:polyhydroxyalkanoate synthesis regulator phasin
MRRLGEIRALKSKPSLKDMIMESLKKKNQKDEKVRQQIKKKVLEMYEVQAAAVLEDDDIWYNRIIANIDRLLKILTAQTTAIDSLERKINNLTRKIPP